MSDLHADWRRNARARLRKSIALSALVMAALIWLLDFPGNSGPRPEIELRLLPEVPAVAKTEIVEQAVAVSGPDPELLQVPEDSPIDPEAVPESEDGVPALTDWYRQIDDAVASTLDRAEARVSVNPGFDRKRREATARFAPSRAPRPVPIWENVETDQLGRKVLVSGDCYRVVDDPSAVNYEVFRTFHQYLVQCANFRRPPQELPWVAQLRDRYSYLARDDVGRSAPRSQLSAKLY